MDLLTPRARLRRLTTADIANMNLLEGDPAVMRFTRARLPKTIEESEARLAASLEKQESLGPLGFWGAELKTGEFFGWGMLLPHEGPFPELGYMVATSFAGRGLGTELAERLVAYGLVELSLPGISAVVDASNVGSLKVLEKLGFVERTRTREKDLVLDRTVDAIHFERRR